MFPPQLLASWVNGSGLGLDLTANHDRFFDVPLGCVVDVDVRFVVRVTARIEDHVLFVTVTGLGSGGPSLVVAPVGEPAAVNGAESQLRPWSG